jgi:hypothetical protein
MAGATVSSFSSALKNVYLPGIREELNEKTNLLDLFTEGDLTQYEWQGNQLVFALHSSRNYSGVMYVAEGGALPVAGSQGVVNLNIPIAHLKGRIQLSYEVMRASRSDKGSFVRAMDLEQKGLVNDVARQRNRALAGFGSEILAVSTLSTSGVSFTVDNPGGVLGTTNPVRFIKVGMIIVSQAVVGGAVHGVGTVTAVSGSLVTVAAAMGSTSGDVITLGTTSVSATGAGSYGLNPGPDGTVGADTSDIASQGILGLIDNGTYIATIFGLGRTANAFYNSTVMTNVGTINTDILQRGVDNTEEVSGEMIDKFICHSSVRREISKLTEADRRYASDAAPKNYDAGTLAGANKKDLTYNGWSFRTDKDFAYGCLAGVNTSHLQWLPETKGEWAEDDGTILLRVANVDAYEARFRVSENFATDKANAHVMFSGVTVNITSGVYAD